MVTHSMQQAANLGDRLIMMHRGAVLHDFRGAEKRRSAPGRSARRASRASGARTSSTKRPPRCSGACTRTRAWPSCHSRSPTGWRRSRGSSRCLDAFGQEAQLSDDVVFRMTVALDEVVTNIVRHAFDSQGGHDILLGITADDGFVTAVVEDDGPPFDLRTVAPADIDAPIELRPIGGLGRAPGAVAGARPRVPPRRRHGTS